MQESLYKYVVNCCEASPRDIEKGGRRCKVNDVHIKGGYFSAVC